MDEIVLFHKKVIDNFDTAISAFASNDRVLADQVLRNKEEIGMLERELVQAHLDRLRKGFRESIETSHIHLDVIGNLARINSLITHIIYPIVDEKRGRGREDVGIEGCEAEGRGRGTTDERRGTIGRGTKGRETKDEMTAAKRINSVRDLDVYKIAFETAMEIY